MMSGAWNEQQVDRAVAKVGEAAANGKLSDGSRTNLTRWLTEPQYGQYVPRLIELIDGDKFEELDALFWEVIAFGTGGRRGTMGELGTATINERTIAESAHGLAVYLQQVKNVDDSLRESHAARGASGPHWRAVVARDTRNRSPEFARLTATTLAAHGLHVFFFESHRSTPELSFAVRHLKCDVGVMISASHNPPSDNGFKAYWSHGGQVLPPHDKGIIECVYQAGEIPTCDFDKAVTDGLIEIIGDAVDRAYVSAVVGLSQSSARDVPAVFSPLHGVGETSVYRVLREAGFHNVELFEAHRAPDGNFPNVPDHLPNPERHEVFEPIIPRARETGAELILASDPDADRLGACVRDGDGQFVHLSGNRIGALLADYVLRKRTAAGMLSPNHYVVETLVTTPLIGAIARSHGVRVIDDLLVGFKYVAQTMDREGPEKFVFGAEESLGYLAGDYCRDKDAAIAALYLTESAAELRSASKTLLDRLDELFVEHGYFTESQRSEVCRGARGQEQIAELMQAFRNRPPAELGGRPLQRVRDYGRGRHEVRRLPDNVKIEDLPQPEGELLFFESGGENSRFSIAVRPSGTEPKIKFYFFARSDCLAAAELTEVKRRTDQNLTRVGEALSQWVRQVLAN